MSDTLHQIRLYLDSLTSPSHVFNAVSPFFGGPAGRLLGQGAQGDILNNHPAPVPPQAPVPPPALTQTPQAAPAPAPTPPPAPMYPVGSDPMTAGGLAPSMPPPRPPMAQAPAPSVPMPMARPADAPQAPAPMGFFARNTAMMRDPISGDFLDPAAAQKADATGPDVIQKFMNYFHNKDVA